jgi:8-oxo-dGTP pyrophosphatase MutT (NUDIX family)
MLYLLVSACGEREFLRTGSGRCLCKKFGSLGRTAKRLQANRTLRCDNLGDGLYRTSHAADRKIAMKSKTPPRAAGAVVFRRAHDGVKVLLLRAYRNWDFPKGTIEDGETEMEAALREVREETTLEDLRFPHGEVFSETPPYAGGKIARYYLAETERSEITLPVSPELGRPEHHEWRWVSCDEAARLVPPRLVPTVHWARQLLKS